MTANQLSAGLNFRSCVKNRSGKLDKKRFQFIENEFAFWMDAADIAGRKTPGLFLVLFTQI
jgi:hypothetical protein